MKLIDAVRLAFEVRPSWKYASNGTADINTRHAIRVLGEGLSIESIKPSTFTRLADALLKEGYASATCNKIMAALHTVLTEAHLEGVLSSVPSYRRLKEPPASKDVYEPTELDTLLEQALKLNKDGLLLHRTLLFLYLTGARRSELLNLKWNDCELDKNKLTFVDTKNGDDHTISIHPELKPVLLEMHRERIDDDKVFPWQSRNSLNNRMKKLKKITGLGSKRALHQIRHTTATRLVDEGVEIRAIQAVLNHRSIKTTLKYAKALDETKAKAINSLSLAYESGEP